MLGDDQAFELKGTTKWRQMERVQTESHAGEKQTRNQCKAERQD